MHKILNQYNLTLDQAGVKAGKVWKETHPYTNLQIDFHQKQPVGDALSNIVSGYQVIHGGQVNQDAVMSKCRNVISSAEKMDKEIGGEVRSGNMCVYMSNITCYDNHAVQIYLKHTKKVTSLISTGIMLESLSGVYNSKLATCF